MEKFEIIYFHEIDDYFNPEYFDFLYFTKKDYGYLKNSDRISFLEREDIKRINELKDTIIKDFKRVSDYSIKYLANNQNIREEIELLIETYKNEIDFSSNYFCNYMFLTDDYLCFNNYENYIDELLLGSLSPREAKLYETIVIVNRAFTEFYFIKKIYYMLNGKECSIIRNFKINDGEILEESRLFAKPFSNEILSYFEDGEVKKIIKKINSIKRL